MTKIERVQQALNHEIPDQVPKGELLIDTGLIRDFLGKSKTEQVTLADKVNFLEELNIDLYSLQPQAIVSDGTDPWGRSVNPETKVWNTVIPNKEAISQYQVPTLNQFDFSEFKQWRSETDFYIFAVISGGFDITGSLLGFMNFLKFSGQCTKEIQGLFEKIIYFNTELGKSAIQAGAHGIIIGDDIAYNQGTFMNPKILRELLFPYLKRQVTELKKLGVPVLFHADGNLMQVLDDIVEMGFDGLHSLQPSSGMNIGEIKKQFGDKLSLMGNMDLDYLLPKGSRAEIESAVKETIDSAKKNGGYIFGTCGALSEGLPLESVKYLYQVAEKYGRY